MSRSPLFNKTRIAPTPSGYLHLGNILSFALTSAMAQREDAKVLLRIDDADRERTNKIFVHDIFDTLSFLEIPWHEGPRNMREYEQEYSQVHRVGLYNKALEDLAASGQVFACTCSRADLARRHPESVYSGTCKDKGLPLDTKDASWRVHTLPGKVLTMQTPGGAVQATLPGSMQYFMVKKRDGFGAYQLTSVVDDMHFGVDMIVRGADLWPSTLAQLYLAAILGYTSFSATRFYHHPLIMDANGEKMSKSAGSTSIHYLRQEGRTAEEIYTLAGNMAGATGLVINRQQLATAIGTNLLSVK